MKWISYMYTHIISLPDNPLDTIKLLEEDIGETLYDINHSKIFFATPPRLMKIKTKIHNEM